MVVSPLPSTVFKCISTTASSRQDFGSQYPPKLIGTYVMSNKSQTNRLRAISTITNKSKNQSKNSRLEAKAKATY